MSLRCWLFGHDYELREDDDEEVTRTVCLRCGEVDNVSEYSTSVCQYCGEEFKSPHGSLAIVEKRSHVRDSHTEECEVCGESFEGEHAAQSLGGHVQVHQE